MIFECFVKETLSIFQIFSRKIRPKEIQKVFSLRHDSTAVHPFTGRDLLRQRPYEDHEHEDRLLGTDAE